MQTHRRRIAQKRNGVTAPERGRQAGGLTVRFTRSAGGSREASAIRRKRLRGRYAAQGVVQAAGEVHFPAALVCTGGGAPTARKRAAPPIRTPAAGGAGRGSHRVRPLAGATRQPPLRSGGAGSARQNRPLTAATSRRVLERKAAARGPAMGVPQPPVRRQHPDTQEVRAHAGGQATGSQNQGPGASSQWSGKSGAFAPSSFDDPSTGSGGSGQAPSTSSGQAPSTSSGQAFTGHWALVTGPCLSELPHEAQLGAVAVEVLRLGVGQPHVVDERQLRAEAEQGEGAVEHR